ncbi:MAG: beta-propeller domain-containing protein [Propionibacteriaceae bacterium]|jgi:uncharacterized secreted protein with C-terminal beta-propeller domain|nr:beta-propeller domain-containing protein [Propionibacteriaceae bacterium]
MNKGIGDIFADMVEQMKPSDELLAALSAQTSIVWRPPGEEDIAPPGITKPRNSRVAVLLAVGICTVSLLVAGLLGTRAYWGKLTPILPTSFINQVADDYHDLYQTITILLNSVAETGDFTVDVSVPGSGVPGAGNSPEQGVGRDSSGTNVQVAGIDEADIIKADGDAIYILTYAEVVVLAPEGATTREIARFSLPEMDGGTNTESTLWPLDMLLYDDTLAVIVDRCTSSKPSNNEFGVEIWAPQECFTEALLYDVSDPAYPQFTTSLGQSGSFNAARLSDGVLYLVSNYYLVVPVDDVLANTPTTFAPLITVAGDVRAISPNDIGICPGPSNPGYVIVSSIDMAKGTRIDQKAVLGASDTTYMSTENLYFAGSTYVMVIDQQGFVETATAQPTAIATAVPPTSIIDQPEIAETAIPQPTTVDTAVTATPKTSRVIFQTNSPETNLVRISLLDGFLDIAAHGKVPGVVMGQFALDEYQGNLRIATTTEGADWSANSALYVLNPDLVIIGSIDPLIADESVQSVRFVGAVGYVVTFRQTDPLFVVDLANPANPHVTSELQLSGFSSYLHPWGVDRLLGLGFQGDANGITRGMKLSVFDISDPFAVSELQALLLNCDYSEAGYDHHAVLADEMLRLVAFPAISYSDKGGADFSTDAAYLVYRDTGIFELVASIPLPPESYRIRGMLIEQELYLYDGITLKVFTTDNFDTLATVEVN